MKTFSIAARLCVVLSSLLIPYAFVSAERLPVKIYSTADGLAHERIKRIVRDSRGFLWFCTADGLSRFDGHSFTTYLTKDGLPNSVTNDLLETRRGEYWVATYGGVLLFNPLLRSGENVAARFTAFPVGDTPESDRVNARYEDRRGRIWAGTDGGLFFLDPAGTQNRKFHQVEPDLPNTAPGWQKIFSLLEDQDGTLWIGTEAGLVQRQPDGRLSLPVELRLAEIWSLIRDGDGTMWAGTSEGLLHFDPSKAGRIRLWTMRDGIGGRVIRTVFRTSDGRLWAGTNSNGIAVMEGERFRQYTSARGLPDDYIRSLAEDSAGNLWIGTHTGGVVKLSRYGFISFREDDALRRSFVRSLFENQAGQICLTDAPASVYYFDGQLFQLVQFNVPPKSIQVPGWRRYNFVFQDRAGEWWVPTGDGLYRFDGTERMEQLAQARPKAIYKLADGLPSYNLMRMFEDSRGDVWMGMLDRITLVRWERSTGRFHSYAEADGLPPNNAPLSFAEDRAGNVWFGFREGGLARYSAGRVKFWPSNRQIPASAVYNLFVDRGGRLWIPTEGGGLFRADDLSASELSLVAMTTAQGLSSNAVRCVTEDEWGRIYAGTIRGVDRLNLATGDIKHYSVSDGLSYNELNWAIRDRTGALWFGTYRGLSKLVPEPDLPANQLQPLQVLIRGLRVAGVAYPVSELGEAAVTMPELSADKNQIQIDYFGFSFGAGEALRYQYKLEGSSLDWSLPTDQRAVEFPKLPPGQYRFLVRAAGVDGASSVAPAMVAFTILPPLWLRGWFVALAVLILAGALYALYRYRLSRVLEVERVRMRIATDLHDDIGAGLSRIAILSEVVQQRVGTGDLRVGQQIASISGASQELVDSMSDIVWAINPQKEHLTDLVHRMRRFASDVLSGRNIEFRFQAPPPEQDVRLGADLRREVYLIFKESINNLARHSGAANAEIELRADRRFLTLQVKDNGRGFDPAALNNGHAEADGDGNGLRSMYTRARRMGGELQLLSSNDQGTTIFLRVPMNQSHFLEKSQTENPRLRHRYQKPNGKDS